MNFILERILYMGSKLYMADTVHVFTGDGSRQRSGPGDGVPAGQGGGETGVRGHKRGGRQRDVGDHQRRQDGRRHSVRLLHDQRGRLEPGERAGQDGGGEMGQSGHIDQQRRNRGQCAADEHDRRTDQADGRRQLDGTLLGESVVPRSVDMPMAR